MVNDPQYLEDLFCEFSHINENRRMPDGSPITMEGWLQEHHTYYEAAYPVSEYEKLSLVKTKVTDDMSRTYQSAMAEELTRFRDSKQVASK